MSSQKFERGRERDCSIDRYSRCPFPEAHLVITIVNEMIDVFIECSRKFDSLVRGQSPNSPRRWNVMR